MVSNVLYYSSIFWEYLWIFKVEILTGVFVGLSIFEYFYRIYLASIREKQLYTLKSRFIELKKELLIMKDLTKHELEHKLLANKMSQFSEKIDLNNTILSNQINSNHELVISQINTNQRVLLIQYTAEFDVLNKRFDYSDKKINGALGDIKTLKSDTDFIRTIKKYKIFVGVGLASMIAVTGIDELRIWISKILPWN